jgi:hypothetical protein
VTRPNEKTLLERIAGYTLAALGACALMVTTADATQLVHGADVKPRPSAQTQSKHGSLIAQSSKEKGSLPTAAARRHGRDSGQRRTRWTSKTGAAARWRTGRRRPCGRRCR